jgi:hypothetical protein
VTIEVILNVERDIYEPEEYQGATGDKGDNELSFDLASDFAIGGRSLLNY